MTRDAFLELVREGGTLVEGKSAALAGLVDTFPYAASLRVLHLKALHSEGSIGYERALKRTAVHAHNRQALYQYVMQPAVKQAMQAVETTEEQPAEMPAVQQEVAETAPVAAPEQTPIEELAEQPEPAKTAVKLQEHQAEPEAIQLPEPVVEPTGEVEAEAEEAVGTADLDPLEQEVLREVISASLLRELAQRPEAPAEQAEKAAEEQEAEPVAAVEPPKPEEAPKAAQPRESADKQPEADQEPRERVEKAEPSAPRGFTDWLRVLDTEKEAAKRSAPAAEIASEQEAEAAEQPQAEDAPAEKPQGSKPSDLIDRFLGGDNLPAAPKAEFFNPTNMARMSLVDDSAFVSETLAEIYVRQQYYEKALEAFRQLSLANPEKSAYFASRIAEINRLKKKK